MLHLTRLQTIALPVVEWLVDDSARAEGRTELMAYVAVLHAIKHRGHRITPKEFSINSHFQTQKYFIECIVRQLEEYNKTITEENKIKYKIYKTDLSIEIF